MKSEEAGVAGDEVRRMPIHRKFQKLVVLGIAAGGDGRRNLNPLSFPDQRGEEEARFFQGHIFPELLPPEDIIQLRQNGEGEQYFALIQGAVESTSRNGVG